VEFQCCRISSNLNNYERIKLDPNFDKELDLMYHIAATANIFKADIMFI